MVPVVISGDNGHVHRLASGARNELHCISLISENRVNSTRRLWFLEQKKTETSEAPIQSRGDLCVRVLALDGVLTGISELYRHGH
jgi:hypothetical protein